MQPGRHLVQSSSPVTRDPAEAVSTRGEHTQVSECIQHDLACRMTWNHYEYRFLDYIIVEVARNPCC